MEHSGEVFITTEMMLGFTSMESFNDFTADEILVSSIQTESAKHQCV